MCLSFAIVVVVIAVVTSLTGAVVTLLASSFSTTSIVIRSDLVVESFGAYQLSESEIPINFIY